MIEYSIDSEITSRTTNLTVTFLYLDVFYIMYYFPKTAISNKLIQIHAHLQGRRKQSDDGWANSK